MANVPIRKLLIANRGEIACRIIKTAKRMNIETLAIYSTVDQNAMHVRLADEAHYAGEAEPQRSYLNQDKILELALTHGVAAIHPGYGFLSENSEFSQRCQDENVIFVGPRASSIKTMGIKNESKRIMIEAGVPVVPGYHGLEQDNDLLVEEARKIGYPVLIKPVRGGGGKGMRVVHKEAHFLEALESSRRESLKSFNDQSMLLEKYIEKPRHVEVQIFGDHQGNHVYLFERDCSVQRRHQKIIEEAPAPLLSEEKRQQLGQQAVAAAKAVGYVGAGTVEFILDKTDNSFYFMEMNTRLQVEHPITEMITQTDLVEWQLRVAAGERLPKNQEQIRISGHAFEARIYAEDPDDGFLPQTGRLNFICLPDGLSVQNFTQSTSITRLDTGVTVGDMISPYYDPMIAKLVVWDKDRTRALKRLNSALKQYIILGLPTNIKFLKNLSENKSFVEADVGTDFIDLHRDELFSSKTATLPDETTTTTRTSFSNLLLAEISASIYKIICSSTDLRLRKEFHSFRILAQKKPTYVFKLKLLDSIDGEKLVEVKYVSKSHNSAHLSLGLQSDSSYSESIVVDFEDNNNEVTVNLNDKRDIHKFTINSPVLSNSESNETILVLRNNGSDENRLIRAELGNIFNDESESSKLASTSDPLLARAPMPGIIEKVLVCPGDSVAQGQSLVIMSAMKMEYTIKSGSSGLVSEISHKPGEFVAKEAILVKLAASESDKNQ